MKRKGNFLCTIKRTIMPSMIVGMFMLISLPASAEILNETSVNVFYANLASVAKNGPQIKAYLNDRLDPNYSIESIVVANIGENEPIKSSGVFDKQTVVDDSANFRQEVKIEVYKNSVASVSFSGDRRNAYVEVVTTVAGQMVDKKDRSEKMANYGSATRCRDTLALVNQKITITHSLCSTNLTIKKSSAE